MEDVKAAVRLLGQVIGAAALAWFTLLVVLEFCKWVIYS